MQTGKGLRGMDKEVTIFPSFNPSLAIVLIIGGWVCSVFVNFRTEHSVDS